MTTEGKADVRRRARARRGAPLLEPVDPTLALPLEQQVYARLRDALMAGRVPAGTALSVRSLAEALRVSKTPVRDALKRLEADGVIQSRPRSAFLTAPLSVEEFDSILAVRLQLEGWAAAEAARNADAGAVQRVCDAAASYVALGGTATSEELSAANYDFHFAIYRAAGNPILLDLISNLWVRMAPLLARVPPIGIERNVSHHVAASAAIAANNPVAASAAIRDDLSSAARTIRATIARLSAAAPAAASTARID